MAPELESRGGSLEQGERARLILSVNGDGGASVAAHEHVMNSSREILSERSGHPANLAHALVTCVPRTAPTLCRA